MNRFWISCCAVVVIFAVLLAAGRVQPAAAAGDHVALANRAVEMWNQVPEATSGVYYGGENDLLTWQDNHPADDLIAFGHVLHVAGRPDVIDSAGPRLLVAAYRTAFPDLLLTAAEPVVENDLVTVRWTLRGTFQNAFIGLDPTGRIHEEAGTFVFRIAGGQVVETWVQATTVSALIQDGATPSADPAICAQAEETPTPPRVYEGGTPDPSKDDPYYTGA